MSQPTESDLREYVRIGWSDAKIGEHHDLSQRLITKLRRGFGIICCNSQYSNGTFFEFEREIRALIEPDAVNRMSAVRFEDSPAAIRAQAGGYGQLPPRAEHGMRGGSMVMVENC